MDVDNLPTHYLAKLRRQHLHVPSQHHKLDIMLLDEIQNLRLLLLLRVLVDGQVMELDPITLSQSLVIRVIADNDRDIDTKLLVLRSEQEVVETMANLRDHNEDFGLLGFGPDGVIHLHVFSELGERFLQGFCGLGMAEVYAHEELLAAGVGVLLEVQDVEALFGQETSDIVHDTRLVRTRKRENVVVRHNGVRVPL